MKTKLITIISLLYICLLPVNAQINTDRVLSIGKNALYFEDYVLSIQYFNQVIRAKPYLAEPYLFRAIAKFSLDDYKGAEEDATLCLERNPFLLFAYQCRGAARQSLQNYEGAIDDYNKGLEFKPEDRQMLINKGIAYAQLNEYDKAEGVLDSLILYHPKYTNAYLTRGAVLMEKGDTLKALNNFNTAVSFDKFYAPVYAQRGYLYFQIDSLQNSLGDFDEAIRLDPLQMGYYINRGLVRFYLDDLRGAMSDYDMVISSDPQNLIARFNRGLLRAQVGDTNRSIEDFDVVIAQEPDNFPAIYNRALLKDEIGDFVGAIEDINLVLEEYPNFVPGYYARSGLKRKMNNIQGADRDYWLAYELEQKLKNERAKGKIVTGREVLDEAETADGREKVREKSDKNIEKFNRLVTYDKTEEKASKYNNEVRGRVQDKNVRVDLTPLFVITYYEKLEEFKRPSFADQEVAEYNRQNQMVLQLQVTNNEVALNDEQAEYHFSSINSYSLQISNDENNPNLYFNRGLDYMVLQDLIEALNDFDRAIELNPDFAFAYFNRAVVRYKQQEIKTYSENAGDPSNLSMDITGKKLNNTTSSPISFDTDNPVASRDSRLYEFEIILRDFDKVTQLNPDFVYAYFNKGNIYCAKKDFRSALVEYNKAIEKNPDFAEAYYNRGLTRLSLGETERGIADLSKAGELGIIDAYSIIKRMTDD